MNYRRVMGVEKIAARARDGLGVRIAVLDSGSPISPLRGGVDPVSCSIAGEPADVFGHATSIASILFGGSGIVGLCEAATPVYIKVLDDSGKGSVEDVSEGIEKAIELDVDIINMSLGFVRTEKCPSRLEKACEMAKNAGKTVICAAGNDGGAVNWPAALKTTVCVGSAGKNGLKTAFSSVGEVDFVAPGLNLSVLDASGRLKTVSGTSFSAAIVTGVAALLVNDMRSGHPRWAKGESVTESLRLLAKDVGAAGYDHDTGYGYIYGKSCDPTVGMKIGRSFFGRILYKITSLIGLKAKE